MLSPATFQPFRQRHVAGEIYPQRNVAGEKLMGEDHESKCFPLPELALPMFDTLADAASAFPAWFSLHLLFCARGFHKPRKFKRHV
ncbi:hypothetical protein Tco_0132807 [Tanacetum coccineum]